MLRMPWTRLAASLIGAVFLQVVAVGDVAGAHEEKVVGGITLVAGWDNEPAFAGHPNAAELFVTDGAGQPIADLVGKLKIDVTFGEDRTGPQELLSVFGEPGHYRVPLVPTRAGDYSFHVTGSVGEQAIDVTFVPGPDTFDPVSPVDAIEFPESDPSRAELATRVGRLDARVGRADSEDDGTALGTVLGGLGLVVGLVALVLSLRRRGSDAA